MEAKYFLVAILLFVQVTNIVCQGQFQLTHFSKSCSKCTKNHQQEEISINYGGAPSTYYQNAPQQPCQTCQTSILPSKRFSSMLRPSFYKPSYSYSQRPQCPQYSPPCPPLQPPPCQPTCQQPDTRIKVSDDFACKLSEKIADQLAPTLIAQMRNPNARQRYDDDC